MGYGGKGGGRVSQCHPMTYKMASPEPRKSQAGSHRFLRNFEGLSDPVTFSKIFVWFYSVCVGLPHLVL